MHLPVGLLSNFVKFAEQRDSDVKLHGGGYPEGTPPQSVFNSQLAPLVSSSSYPRRSACPELTAVLFTLCVTSPIDIALRYSLLNNQLPNRISTDQIMQLPGDLKDRQTPLGQLNWSLK